MEVLVDGRADLDARVKALLWGESMPDGSNPGIALSTLGRGIPARR